MELKSVALDLPRDSNLILGQAHFIKTIEDLYEILVGSSPSAQFGIAFCEASGPCLIRVSGNNTELQDAATSMAEAIAAGHSFIILMKEIYPLNALNAVKNCPEVCGIFCATANPVEAIVAESARGRGIVGVIDGFSPKGVESADDVNARHELLRQLGYKQ